MSQNLYLEAELIPHDHYFSLEECCHTTQSTEAFIVELITENIIVPVEQNQNYLFTVAHINKIKRAYSYSVDLGVNMEGIALALELLEQIEALKAS